MGPDGAVTEQNAARAEGGAGRGSLQGWDRRGQLGGVARVAEAARVTKDEAADEERTRRQRQSQHSGEAAAKSRELNADEGVGGTMDDGRGTSGGAGTDAAATSTTSAGDRDLR